MTQRPLFGGYLGLQTGEWGIQSTSSHNTWQTYTKIQEFDMQQACRSWAAYMLQLIRLILPGYKAEHNRPSNGRFQCWAMGILMRFNGDMDAQVHTRLQEQFANRQITKMSMLFSLPAAAMNPVKDAAVNLHGLHRFWS